MNNCPYCKQSDEQVKNGMNPSGSQRWRCQHCQRNYTPQPAWHGHTPALRQQAIQLYVDGMNLRRIARHLQVSPQSVANWVNAYVAQLPPAPLPEGIAVVEQDELYTFVGAKKSASTS